MKTTLFLTLTLILGLGLSGVAAAKPKKSAAAAKGKMIKFHAVNKSCAMGFKYKRGLEFMRCDDNFYRVKLENSSPEKHPIASAKWNHRLSVLDRKIARLEKRKPDLSAKKKASCVAALYVGENIYAKCFTAQGKLKLFHGKHGQKRGQMKRLDDETIWQNALREIASK